MDRDDDAELVIACQHGNRDAIGTLLGKYEKTVFNAALRILNSRDDAADVTQTVFVKVIENFDGVKPELKFYSWIYRIGINESLDFLKRKQRLTKIDDRHASTDRGPEDLCGQDQISRSLQDALMTLSPEYRSVIVLKHLLGCSYRDASEILGVPEKTVKSRLFSARQRLRDALKSQGKAP